MKDKAKLQGKIRKLLALANDKNKEGDAYNAMALAQKLLAENGWTVDQIEVREEDVARESLNPGTKTPSSNYIKLAACLAQHFRCSLIKHTGGVKSWLEVLGEQTDVETLKTVLEYAYNVQEKAFKEFHAKHPTKDRSASIAQKNDFVRGYRGGLDKALTSNEQEYGLMVIVPNAVQKIMKEEVTRQYKFSAAKTNFDMQAFQNGYHEGEEAMKRRNQIEVA